MKKTKKSAPSASFPDISSDDVKEKIRKSETINFRLTRNEKESIAATASALGLTVSEYLLKCHAVISSKVDGQA